MSPAGGCTAEYIEGDDYGECVGGSAQAWCDFGSWAGYCTYYFTICDYNFGEENEFISLDFSVECQ